MGEGGGGGGWPRDTGLVLIASPRQRSIVHWRGEEREVVETEGGGWGGRGRRQPHSACTPSLAKLGCSSVALIYLLSLMELSIGENDKCSQERWALRKLSYLTYRCWRGYINMYA